MPKPYERLTVDGHTLDWMTYAAFLAAQARPDGDNDWTILQGCYNAGGVSQSAGTHDGGGALDVSPFNADQRVHAMRAVGFAAWHRLELFDADGNRIWGEHIHAVLPGNAKMAPLAKLQAQEYPHRRDGLGAFPFGPDDTWHPDPIPAFDYQQWIKENAVLPGDLDKIKAAIKDGDDRVIAVLQHQTEIAANKTARILAAIDALPDTALTKKDVRAVVDKALAATGGTTP